MTAPCPKLINFVLNGWQIRSKKGQYDTAQKLGDKPYEIYPAPTKIPGAALEFDAGKFGKVVSNELDTRTDLSTVTFQNGVVFTNYIHAIKQVVYFSFENYTDDIIPVIKIPSYHLATKGTTGNSV